MGELQDRLDELMDIQQKFETLDERMSDMGVDWDDLEEEIRRCRYRMAEQEEADREALRHEYERMAL